MDAKSRQADARPASGLEVLSRAEVAFYRKHGYLEVKKAFPRETALRLADCVWEELRERDGILKNDPSTWFQPARAPRRAKSLGLNRELATSRIPAIVSQLRDGKPWREPEHWGGFLLTFPRRDEMPWTLPAATWHWDGTPGMTGPFIFSFYSSVPPGGGGTLLVSGSPRLLRQFYDTLGPEERQLPHREHRRRFFAWRPWLAELTDPDATGADRIAKFMRASTEVDGVRLRVVELCGEPGDAVFCDPLMLHAIARNCSRDVRLMRSMFLFY